METESQNKPTKSHKTRNIILIIVTILAIMGTVLAILFVVDYSRLNERLTADNKDLEDEIDAKEEEIETSEDNVASLEEEKSGLITEKDSLSTDLKTSVAEYEDLIGSYDDLQENLVVLLEEAECDEDLLDLDVSYVSNASVSKALKSWAEAHMGSVTGADYFVFWRGSKDSLHSVTIEDAFTSLFLVFFDNTKYDVVDAVYFLDDECWLDGPWREFVPGESAKADLPANSWLAIAPFKQEPFYTALLPESKLGFLGL